MRFPPALLAAAAVAVAVPVLGTARAATDPTAPTATRSPAALDAIWQRATAPYAAARNAELARVAKGDAEGPFRPDWASLEAYKAPDWYRDAKFGIFIHWGVFSVPSFGNEWYSRNMYAEDGSDNAHQIALHGPLTRFGYKDYIPLFTASRYDPAAWAKLFRTAGARYVVPVAEHHDGFALYASRLSDWTAVKMGPKRDLIGDLAKAVRAEGLHFGVSSHRAEHDWFMDTGRTQASDVNDPRYAAFYGPAQMRVMLNSDDIDVAHDFTPVSQAWLDDWLARSAELVDLYHPDLMYFDWWIGQPSFRNTLPKFVAYYYNEQAHRGAGAVVNYKIGAFPPAAGVLDIERGQLPGIQPLPWQTCTSISNLSWGYIEHDTYKSPREILHLLADVVSKNGNLLLNVGPKPDGTIPQAAIDTLTHIGAWLGHNGEAVYGTRPWRIFGEGPTAIVSGSFQEGKLKPYTAQDFRFTTHGATLYAIELAAPAGGTSVIHALGQSDHVRAVTLVATGQPVSFHQEPDGLHLALPAGPVDQDAIAYRIAF